jgi:outer membrane protein TolC
MAGLSSAVGVSGEELRRIGIVTDHSPRCPEVAPRDSLERAALEARRELYRVLADYQVAEGDVRVEIARSWPDLALGPGLFFDHGVNKWTIAFGMPSLLLNRNRGPIGEAEARREVAARRVAEVQEQVIGEVEQAIAGCTAAAGEVAALDVSGARLRVELADRAFDRGEIGRLEVASARLEYSRALRRVTEAEARLRAAGLELERATGIWSGAAPLPRPEKGEL